MSRPQVECYFNPFTVRVLRQFEVRQAAHSRGYRQLPSTCRGFTTPPTDYLLPGCFQPFQDFLLYHQHYRILHLVAITHLSTTDLPEFATKEGSPSSPAFTIMQGVCPRELTTLIITDSMIARISFPLPDNDFSKASGQRIVLVRCKERNEVQLLGRV